MPNASMDGRLALRFLLGMCIVSFGIAGFWAWRGFWMLLPFAGLEMLCLAGGLAWALHQNRFREVLRIEGSTLHIERGHGRIQQQWNMPLHWVRVAVQPPRHRGEYSRVELQCSAKRVEVGRVLSEEERLQLASRLQQWLRQARDVSLDPA
ncbi:MAG: DUF2244 domain-containing protein [Oceanococcaceae bacterium]